MPSNQQQITHHEQLRCSSATDATCAATSPGSPASSRRATTTRRDAEAPCLQPVDSSGRRHRLPSTQPTNSASPARYSPVPDTGDGPGRFRAPAITRTHVDLFLDPDADAFVRGATWQRLRGRRGRSPAWHAGRPDHLSPRGIGGGHAIASNGRHLPAAAASHARGRSAPATTSCARVGQRIGGEGLCSVYSVPCEWFRCSAYFC